jgi:hypothetical protein
MKELRRLGLHVLLLILAATAAYAKSRPEEKTAKPMQKGEVELWAGSSKDVTKVSYQDDRKVVTLVAKEDAEGRWFQGSVEPSVPKADAEKKDAGAAPPPMPVEASVFAAVEQAGTLVGSLAPLRAKRALGEVAPDRLTAFGLEKPPGTLRVTFGDKTRELVIGGATPGDTDRYVRDGQSGLVYVLDNAFVRDLQSADTRLPERKLHSWQVGEVSEATIKAGGKERRLVRGGTEGRRFWADAATPDQNDETANNWLQKVDRLRPMTYLDALPEDASSVVRVEYRSSSKALGFVELHRRVVDEKDEYVVSSEYTRMSSTVPASLGEQIAEDLGSLVK